MRNVFFILLLGLLLGGCTSVAPIATGVVTEMTESETASPLVRMTPKPPQESPESTTSYPVESDESILLTPTPEPTVSPLPGTLIFTFTGDEPGWYTVDDDVMGGVSSSTVEFVDPSLLSFTGDMSLENNGGFASVRSDWTPMNLSDADGVLLRVLGDGNLYRLRIRTKTTGSDISYNALFQTTPETWSIVYIPFTDMLPTYRGFLMDVGELDRANIGSFGFMLSDKQPGKFRLLVDWIRAVSEKEIQAPPSLDSVALNR